MIRPLLLSLFVAATPVLAAETPATASKLVRQLLEDQGEMRDAIRGMSDPQGGFLFGDDEEDHREDLEAALDRALDLIAPDTHDRYAERVREIEDGLLAAEKTRADLLFQRRIATDAELGVLDRLLMRETARGSAQDVATRLKQAEADIAALKSARSRTLSAFREDLATLHGIELSEAEARALLYPVNGGATVEAMVVVGTLIEVERQLRALLEEDLSPEVMQDYYGVVAVTRLLYSRMLVRHEAAYDEVWLPRLSAIREDAQALLSETEGRIADAQDEGNREVYEGNAQVQRRILDVVDAYEVMLRDRRDRIADALAASAETSDAAINTLRTIDSAAGVASLVRESMDSFEAITEIEVPDFLRLDDEAIFEQFLDISRQLSG